ncbi:MAG: hypothetical protein WC073_10870 [Sterolibacterium sp.]
MKIELILPHEHAGRNYPAGSVLDLPTDAAEWLIAIKAANSHQPSAVSKKRGEAAQPTES